MNNNKIRVLVADDNVAFGLIICEYLESQDDIEVTAGWKMVKMLSK